MIARPLGYYQLLVEVVPRLDLAHGDLTRIVGILRDARQGVTTNASAPGGYNLLGWRDHFAGEIARFTAARDTYAATLKSTFPDVMAQLDAYLEAAPRVVAALDLVLAKHPAGESRAVTAEDQATLATAIESELES